MKQSIKLGVIMDPINQIHYKKDSTLAMLLEAQQRGWHIHYFEQNDLFLRDGEVYGNARHLKVFQDENHWFEFGKTERVLLSDLDVILMRKDPPFNIEYIYTTHLLEMAEQHGALVVNKPQSLRDVNEKLFASWFPECCPPTLVTRDHALLKAFLKEHQTIVCKPLAAMGGFSVFCLKADDPNANVVFETLTQNGAQFTMVQRFIPEIKEGDKRIILIDGQPIPYALARMPAAGDDWRGNLAAGAKGVAKPLTDRDRWICEQVGPTLSAKGLIFVGLDVIGDYLTEINVTSPTCIRELDAQCDTHIAQELFDVIEAKLRVP